MNRPQTDEEWAIHAINIHGVFFERWCQRAIADTGRWRVAVTNYPVAYPPPRLRNTPHDLRYRESTLDIRAELVKDYRLLTLLIECKKNDPDFVDWVFFPQKFPKEKRFANLHFLANHEIVGSGQPYNRWSVSTELAQSIFSDIFADDARETKGQYHLLKQQTKTKTSNAAIFDAAHQIALASQAIHHEEREISDIQGRTNPPKTRIPWLSQVFIPSIVTTARLLVCEFDPAEIDPARGEIPNNKPNLKEVPYLVFKYPLPKRLQEPNNTLHALIESQRQLEAFVWLDIFVVNSQHFSDFLWEVDQKADLILP